MLTLTYVALAIAGCGYVVFALVTGQMADGDGGLDAADGGFHFAIFSPTTLAAFFGATGAFGLIATFGLGLSGPAAVAVSIVAGLAFAYVVTYAAWRLLTSSTGTQTLRESDLVGASAEVFTPIPEGGLGEVVAMVRGQRHAAPARSATGEPLPRGTLVSVERVAGATLVVRPESAAVRNA